MNWTFCRVKLKQFEDFPEEWVLRIDNADVLLDYWMTTFQPIAKEAYANYIAVSKKEAHFSNATAYVAHIRAGARGESFVDALGGLMEDKIMGMLKILREGKILYIKHTRGYSFDTVDEKLYAILETRELTEPIFPTAKSDLKITRWPNGKHYYARIGTVDVVVGGKSKWSSRAAAERAANKFIEATFGNQ